MYKALASKLITAKFSDEALKNLQEYLFTQTTFYKARKINRFGYDAESDIFFFANVAIQQSQHYKPNDFNIIELAGKAYSFPEKNHKKENFFIYKPSPIDFDEFFQIFSELHGTEIAFMCVSFYMLSLFRDIAYHRVKQFPMIFLKGGAGTGKSSIARAISALFGNVPKANLKSNNTAAALVKIMSQSSNMIVWFDEYNNEAGVDGIIRAIYDNDGYIRSRDNNSSKIDSLDIYSSLFITSNYLPDDQILFTRFIYVDVPVPQKTERQRSLFQRLEAYIEKGISSITADMLVHRNLIEKEFATYYDQILRILKFIAKERQETDIEERFFTNMAMHLTPISILACHDKIQICEFTSLDKTSILDYVCYIGYKYMRKHFKMMSETSSLARFFELLNTMYERFILHEDVHFRIGTGEHEGKIALRFGKIYTLFAEQYRKIYFNAPPKKDEIKQEIMNFLYMNEWKEVSCKLYNDFSDNEKESVKVVWLDYEPLQKTFELELHKRRNIKNV